MRPFRFRMIIQFLAPAVLASLIVARAVANPPPSAADSPAETLAKSISNTIAREATALDLLLAGKRYTTDRNQSMAEVKQHFSWRDYSGFKDSTDFNLDIRLPNLEKRWALRFSSYDEEEEDRDVTQGVVRQRARTKRPGAAAVFAGELGNVKTVFQPRVILKNPLVLNYILRLQSSAESGNFSMNPQVELFADAEKGTGEFGSIEFRYRLTPRSAISFRSEEEYSDFENKFSTNHSLSIGYGLRENMGIGLTGSSVSSNQPEFHLAAHNLAFVFSHVLKKDRLRYSVSPYLDFPRANQFRGIFGVSFELSVVF